MRRTYFVQCHTALRERVLEYQSKVEKSIYIYKIMINNNVEKCSNIKQEK